MRRFKSKTISMKGIFKMTGIVLGFVLGAIFLFCLIIFLIIWSWSPGKSTPYYDDNRNILSRSISEVVRTEIGGIEQGMIIKGKNEDNPILLFLHGGPGNPEYVLAKQYDIGLEDYFTVCWWDQRGSGMSYSSSIEPKDVTLEQMITDTVEVTNYLRNRFGKKKIYLMGHSWGSFLGINTVAQYPELFEAYIGIGQVTNQLESEKLGYDNMMSIAESAGDKESIEKLGKYKIDGAETITTDYLILRSQIMSKQGNGVFHVAKSQFKDIILPVLQASEYTLSDKYGYIVGAMFALKCPINNVQFNTNLMETTCAIDVPVYIFHGIYDRQVSYELSQQYFEILKAPKKEFYTFGNSAHSPFMEEPQKFIQIIIEDVLDIENTGDYYK